MAKKKPTPGMMTEERLRIDAITVDPSIQQRAKGTDPSLVAEYAQVLKEYKGQEPLAVFPAAVVYRDHEDEKLWLAEGFHRLAAHQLAGLEKIDAIVIVGNKRAAILRAVGANGDHGARRTQEDMGHALGTLLRDPEWTKWSDSAIAERASVDRHTVARHREKLLTWCAHQVSEPPEERKYTNKHGSTSTMKTGKIGGKKKAKTSKVSSATQTSGAEHTAETCPAALESLGNDAKGDPWPERARAALELLPRFEAFVKYLAAAEKEAAELGQTAIRNHLDINSLTTHLKRCADALKTGRPIAVCPYCDGRGTKDGDQGISTCGPCHGDGWVNRTAYENSPKAREVA